MNKGYQNLMLDEINLIYRKAIIYRENYINNGIIEIDGFNLAFLLLKLIESCMLGTLILFILMRYQEVRAHDLNKRKKQRRENIIG